MYVTVRTFWFAEFAVVVCGGMLSCDSERKDSQYSQQGEQGKHISHQAQDTNEKVLVSESAAKKKSELTLQDFHDRMGEALGKYAITEENTSEVEELFLLNRQWAIAAIREARMPWLLGEIMGKDEESKKNGIQWIEENLKGEEQDLCMIGFAQGLGKSDPKSVIGMAENMKQGLVRDRVIGVAILATAKSDVAEASDLYLRHFDDLKSGSYPDLLGLGAGLLIEMNHNYSAAEMKSMMNSPIFAKLMEIDHDVILLVGDAHPDVAVNFCLESNSDPAPLYGMVLRHLARNDEDGVDEVLKFSSGRYSREEMITGVFSLMRNNDHGSMGEFLNKLPCTAYDKEIFTRAAYYMEDNEFNALMSASKSEERKAYLLEGFNARK